MAKLKVTSLLFVLMLIWAAPSSASEVVFYCVYQKNECVEGSDPLPIEEVQIDDVLSGVLARKQNFIGFVDDSGTTLQFFVDAKDKVWVEIPSPKDQGSFGRQMTEAEVREVVGKLTAPFMDYKDELQLVFNRW